MPMHWYGYGDGPGVWGWVAMSVGMVLFWALLITAVVLVVRALRRPVGPPYAAARASAEQVLAERFARGEIDEQEYRTRLSTLTETTAAGAAPPR